VVKKNAVEFFEKLARDGTILLNNLPDILAKLHHGDTSSSDIKKISTFLFKLLSRNERHLGQFIRKLCNRFKLIFTAIYISFRFQEVDSLDKWIHTAQSISALPAGECSIKKLVEFAPQFQDKMQIKEIKDIFASFCENVQNCATLTPETLQLLIKLQSIVRGETRVSAEKKPVKKRAEYTENAGTKKARGISKFV